MSSSVDSVLLNTNMTTILIENISKSFENTVTSKESSKGETKNSVFDFGKALFYTLCTGKTDELKLCFRNKETLKKMTAQAKLHSKSKLFQSFIPKSLLDFGSQSSNNETIEASSKFQKTHGNTSLQQNGIFSHKIKDTMWQKSTRCLQGTQALREVYLEIPKGAITALVGGSGSGKSTLLRIIAGLDKPDIGSIWLNGKNSNCISVQERGIGFVSQSYALFPHMTVLENIAFGLRVKKELPFQIEAKCQYLLKLIQLSNLSSYYPNQLSGGQKQRVALARALAPDPKFLLLDEPFAALDMRMRKELREWIYTLQKQSSVTIVLVTHDYKEALEIATNIVMLKNGHVEQLGDPVDFYDSFLKEKVL